MRIGLYGMIIASTLRSVLAIDGVGLAMVVEQWEGATGPDKATIFVTLSALEGMLDGLRSMTDIFLWDSSCPTRNRNSPLHRLS